MADNALTIAREDLARLLKTADLFAFALAPETVTPPVCLVGPGFPYLSYEGARFGSQILRLSVLIVVDPGTSDVTVNALDDLILRVVDAVDGQGPDEDRTFHVESVGQPGQAPLNGQTYLGVVVEVQTEIHRS